LEAPGNKTCEEKKEDIIDYATMEEGNQHPGTERFNYHISAKDMKTLMEV